jgi:hypothetical protein
MAKTSSDPPTKSNTPPAYTPTQSSTKTLRHQKKRGRWQLKLKLGLVSPVKNKKKQARSANRLQERISRAMVTINTPAHITTLPTTRSGLAGSLTDCQKQYVDRLNSDPTYFGRVLRSLIPVPYKSVQTFANFDSKPDNQLFQLLQTQCNRF